MQWCPQDLAKRGWGIGETGIMNQGNILKLIGNLETRCAQLGHMTISFSLMLKVEVGCSSFSVNQSKCDFVG